MAIAIDKIHVIVIALKKKKKKFFEQIILIVQTIPRLARNYIPCLGQTRAKLYSLLRRERTKTIPCPAAHPRIGHIREYIPRGLYIEDLQNALMICCEVPLFV